VSDVPNPNLEPVQEPPVACQIPFDWCSHLARALHAERKVLPRQHVRLDPPYGELLKGGAAGIFFSTDDRAEAAIDDRLATHWIRRMRPDCPFDIAFLCHVFPTLARGWNDQEQLVAIPEAKADPVRHEPAIAAILEESYGVPFYPDQFVRVLAVGCGVEVRAVSEALRSEAGPPWNEWIEAFLHNAKGSGSAVRAGELWTRCRLGASPACRREWLAVMADDALWFAAVRNRWPALFARAWAGFTR
jgi:hypothetical protein